LSVGLDSSLLLSIYQSQLTSSAALISNQSAAAAAASNASASATGSSSAKATSGDVLPWMNLPTDTNAASAKILNTTNFIDSSNVPLSAATTTDQKTEQDNQKLFTLYNAVYSLATLAKMAQSTTATAGQLAGYNQRLQMGLQQVQQYISKTSFNNLTLQAATPTDTATSTAQIQFADYTYGTKTLATATTVDNPVPGLSASDSFNIGITKGSTTTNVAIDLSQVQGPLTLTNIVSYANQQLSAAGFSTRLQKVLTGGSLTDPTTATYGLQVSPGGVEQVSFSSASATPSLYLAGSTGSAVATTGLSSDSADATTSTTAADQAGRLIKLSNVSSTSTGSPTSSFNVDQQSTSGTTNALQTVVDGNGNIYVLGEATGNFSNQINQGTQDVYLTKYDSAGNVLWSNLLGSAGEANGYSMALNPKGGVVVAGSTTSDLTPTAVADGNTDSFVTSYNTDGSQAWTQQIQTLNNNQANAVTVDASGNVFIGGQTQGSIGAGQTKVGGTDAYVAQISNKGKLVYENQYGTTGNDQVSALATASDGSLYVASVQNGEAIVSKYANGDTTQAPVWQQDMGAIQAGGSISGLTVNGNQLYVSGTTSNGNLTAGGQATVAHASSGGTDAFVFGMTDQGASATSNFVSYVGTGASDTGGAVTVGSDGTVYLTGTTTGTFAGQTRTIAGNQNNMFVTSMSATGAVNWTNQYGGLDGQSTGSGIAIDPQGSSVLDALGLPRGKITLDQSVDLTQETTLRAGNTFQIQIQGVAARTATITIDQGETLQSLSDKINGELGAIGKASVNYSGSAEGLKIQVNAGNTIKLVSGPADSDALSRLGITPGTLTSAANNAKSPTTSTSSTSQSFGLGLDPSYDISTKMGADLARSSLLGVLGQIQSAYQTTNTPPAPAATPGNTTGSASAYTTAQLANYSLALSMLQGTSSSASTTASSSSLLGLTA
jgi:hypothetical protein